MSIPTSQGGTSNSGTDVSPEIRNSVITLRVQFLSPEDRTAVTVTSPTGRLLFNGNFLTPNPLTAPPNANGEYPLEAVPSVVGQYQFSFFTDGLPMGLFDVEFRGTDDQQRTLTVKGQIGIGGISTIQDFMNRVRQGLMDDDPQLYRLDEPVQQWTSQQLYTFMREACDRINNTGPRRTTYQLDQFPPAQDEFLVTGAKIWALYARARLEKANEMTYSDLHSLDIKRADFYKQLADTLYRDWIQAIIDWKKSTPPSPIGINSQRLPFRISRVMGLMPNYQTYFSG